MINKFFKIIHTKYYKFFKFVFFLRYLFAVFLVSFATFLIIPKFFNYEKRVETIKGYLLKNYNIEINQYEKIYFHSFPTPSLELKNVMINLGSNSAKFNVKKFKIFPDLLSIYNYKNFQSKKIILEDNNITLESSNVKVLAKLLFNQKKKFSLNNLVIKINNKNKPIIKLKNIDFANYGYNKNLITGEVFNKKFKINIKEDLKKINYKLINSGVSGEIILDKFKKDDFISGIFKSKILNTNLKFDFNYNYKTLNISNSFFRSKNISFNNNSIITLNPFLFIESNFDITDIDYKVLKKIQLEKLLSFKNIIKKFSSNNDINFYFKKFGRNLIDKSNLKIDLVYGRLNYFKTLSIEGNHFKCSGDLNFLEDYPLIYFDCLILMKNKKELFKKLSIVSKENNEAFDINVKGNLGILNKKINFKNISTNNGYVASKDDLKFYKNSFEEILLDKNFIEIFELKKIKKFILEIS